jgi:cytochrome c55X
MRDYGVIKMRSTLRVTKRMLLALTAVVSVIVSAAAQAQVPAPQRQEELIRLLRNDCGACHGLRLTGGLGPALRPEALQDKTADSLKQVILQGRPGTPMPGWAPFMSENEAQWLAESLVNGVPDEK